MDLNACPELEQLVKSPNLVSFNAPVDGVMQVEWAPKKCTGTNRREGHKPAWKHVWPPRCPPCEIDLSLTVLFMSNLRGRKADG